MRDIEWGGHRSRGIHLAIMVGAVIGFLAACSPGDLFGTAPLPSDLSDPAATHTPAGALAAYQGTLARFRISLGDPTGGYVETAGLLSDELQSDGYGRLRGALSDAPGHVDSRVLPEFSDPASEVQVGNVSFSYAGVYSNLQQVRGQASEALGLLREYAPTTPLALRGHLYALVGYSEVMLAELFCSGIPLSTLDYGGGYTLRPGSSTENVLRHATALFDTALTLAADSDRVLNLSRIGQARALLALGEYAAAAQAVAAVPDGYRYEVSYNAASGASATNFAEVTTGIWRYTVADREGGNGLDYRASGDPRTTAVPTTTNVDDVLIYRPAKYMETGDSPIVLADWEEARLIEAEAALQRGDPIAWLDKLNHLRRNAITPALPDTSDPGTPDARVDLMFRERAFWLFLTGHRQGDMRRLIRQYGRNTEQVYPTGSYYGGPLFYGTAVTAPIPASERISNSLFTGCLSRGG